MTHDMTALKFGTILFLELFKYYYSINSFVILLCIFVIFILIFLFIFNLFLF